MCPKYLDISSLFWFQSDNWTMPQYVYLISESVAIVYGSLS